MMISVKRESMGAKGLRVRRYCPPDVAAQFSLLMDLKAFCLYRRFEANPVLVEAPTAVAKVPHEMSNHTLQLG